ncbi:SDR family oxidoreductase [Luteithermobacter gelatinilyticus]|uniref:SDR family oxidoreductase n=1 Tax=Luteithermobacter gelatinilyticus TaxID=2582913 RepID=UPI001106184A|nr:SDR family oxidoreductase [Luteithermobacter gelatinilyticus]
MTAVLITGAGSGIGLSTALTLANRGYRVYAGLKNPQNIPPELDHAQISPLPLDVTQLSDIDQCVSLIGNEGHELSHLINNAGINIPGPIEVYTQEHWRKIFAINFHGPMTLCRKILPLMRRQEKGRILMISSLSAEIGLPLDGAYAASKAALNRASESLAYEVAPFGIFVTVVIPGSVVTNLNRKHMDEIPNSPTPYAPLYHTLRPSASGLSPTRLAEEIATVCERSNPPLFYPVGTQAQEIMTRVSTANSEVRQQIIREVSGLGWWFDSTMAPRHKYPKNNPRN